MKQKIKKWILRAGCTAVLVLSLLVVIVLKPSLLYANKTEFGNCSIYHNKALDPLFTQRLEKAIQITKASELYEPDVHIDVCVDDGSYYPMLIRVILGEAFGRGFYNKLVLYGAMDCKNNRLSLRGYNWNMEQLCAHEIVHLLQYKKYGLFGSPPLSRRPSWKWEGYPEYVARQSASQKDLQQNISRMLKAQQSERDGWINFEDSTGTIIPYYEAWVLCQYCIDVKKMSFAQLLNDNRDKETVNAEMMTWYYTNLTCR